MFSIKKFELASKYYDFDIKITLKPSFRCNQKCWFCTEYDNSSREWNKEDCDLVIKKLSELFDNNRYKKFWIYFYGGEPTLNKYWEYLQYELLKINPYLFIQTQTNLSINYSRLKTFLENKKDSNIELCSSYHLSKQNVQSFAKKLHLLKEYDAMGLVFFNTSYLEEDKFLSEFRYLEERFPGKIKLRFTEVGVGVQEKPEAKLYPESDNLKSFEFFYFMQKYPEFTRYFEEEFTFDIIQNDKSLRLNFSEVSAKDIHKKFKYMKCECSKRNLVIDHNLLLYSCNDDFKNNARAHKLSEISLIDLQKDFVYCKNDACYDGLEFKKWR